MLTHCANSKLLQHVFVDESHQIVIELSHRPAFTQIKTQFFNFLPKHTNFIFMSRTFNNNMEKRFKWRAEINISRYYRIYFCWREACIQLCVRIELKSIILDNLKVLLETFRVNPATVLTRKLLIYCNTISNTFDLFDEISEVLERTDSNYYKEVREQLVEEAPFSSLQSDALTCI